MNANIDTPKQGRESVQKGVTVPRKNAIFFIHKYVIAC